MTVQLKDRRGNVLRVEDDRAAEFWLGRGYRRVAEPKPAAKKAVPAAKKK